MRVGFYLLPLISVSTTFQNAIAQQQQIGIIKGQLIYRESNLPATSAQVSIPYIKITTYTDATGYFELSAIPFGSHTLVTGNENEQDSLRILVDKDVVYLGELKVKGEQKEDINYSIQIPTVALEINEIADDDELVSASTTSGLLRASRDPFSNTAAFVFGAYRFQARSYERNTQQVLINGVIMNDIETGDAYWSQWGGLNDVFRNRNSVYGIAASESAFGKILGVVNFDITAAQQPKQTRLTYSFSNRQYRHRTMITHSSGMLKSGWAFTVSASARYAGKGYVPGTFYNGFSYYISTSKHLNHFILSFTTLGAPTERGKMAPAVQEAYNLSGSNYYNPNWGWMNGTVKNAKVHKSFQPISMLNLLYEPSNKLSWSTSLLYQFGKLSNSTLDWYNAFDPRPDYYRHLPSYYLFTEEPDSAQALRQKDYFIKNTQINWDKLVQSNYQNFVPHSTSNGTLLGDSARQSLFVIGADVNNIKKWAFNSHFKLLASDRINLHGGVNIIRQTTEHYRELLDLLGGDFYVNRNQFAQIGANQNGFSIDNNIDKKNEEIGTGDKYYYHYVNKFLNVSNWLQAQVSISKIDFFVSGTLGFLSYQRVGKFRNGLFPSGNESFGQSSLQRFLLYGVKAGVTYKLDGRNYFFLNGLLQTDAPTIDNTFISPRTRNATVDQPTEQITRALEGGYLHRSPQANARLVGFLTDINDVTEIKRFYNEGNGANTFTNYVLQDVDLHYMGFEAALEYKINSTLSITGVWAHSQAFYNNNPKAAIYKDNFIDTSGSGGYAGAEPLYIKNYYLATGPQTAATLGFAYKAPRFWYVNLNANYFNHSYVDIAPNRRTEQAVGLLERNTEEFHAIVDQEKLPSFFTLDLFAGKSILLSKIFKSLPRNTFVYLNLGINNLLNNQQIKTGGFEQLRFDADGRIAGRFPSKYFYAYGTNYFINMSLKF